jgi:hypothetical protein
MGVKALLMDAYAVHLQSPKPLLCKALPGKGFFFARLGSVGLIWKSLTLLDTIQLQFFNWYSQPV